MAVKQTRNGFSVVEVLIVIAVAIILAAAGFFAWQKTRKNDTTKHETTNTQSSKQTPDKSTAAKAADPTEGGKYLYIKEWGVRYPLPEDLRGQVNYGISFVVSTSAYSASFEVSSLNAIEGNNCALMAMNEGVGGGTGVQLIRSSGAASDDLEGVGQPIYTSKDGKYYFYVVKPKGLCAPATSEQTELAVDDALVAAIKGLQEP